MKEIVLVVHDIRSCHNVGSLLRTAEGLGIQKVYFSGYTPYPSLQNDSRLPHIHQKLTRQIHKTALGAENTQKWKQVDSIDELIHKLQLKQFTLIALEQAPNSVTLHEYKPPEKLALFIGREVEGIDPAILKKMDIILEIPMQGEKESLNVVQATAIALYQLRFN